MTVASLFASRASRMKASEIRELLKLLERPGIISFAGGIPDASLFPIEAFSKAMQDALALQDSALQYSVSEGYAPLRAWIAAHMGRIGVRCSDENVFITSGSQQALDYLGKLFLSPADTALVMSPTYLGALAAFNAYEPCYDRLSLSGNRSAESYVEAANREGGNVKFAYVSSDFANPTGETLSLEDRLRLLNLADDLNCAIIEDGAYQALRYDGERIPPILSLELARRGTLEECRTIYCGSFSKTLSPGLRVGWVVASKEVISRLVLIKQASDLHSPTLNQVAVHAVAEACFEEHVDRIRDVYRIRRDAMLSALQDHMPANVEWSRPEGGMFIWLKLPFGMDGADVLKRSVDALGVAFVPGHAFHADGAGRDTIRLSFSNSDEAAIQKGISRLGGLFNDTEASA